MEVFVNDRKLPSVGRAFENAHAGDQLKLKAGPLVLDRTAGEAFESQNPLVKLARRATAAFLDLGSALLPRNGPDEIIIEPSKEAKR